MRTRIGYWRAVPCKVVHLCSALNFAFWHDCACPDVPHEIPTGFQMKFQHDRNLARRHMTHDTYMTHACTAKLFETRTHSRFFFFIRKSRNDRAQNTYEKELLVRRVLVPIQYLTWESDRGAVFQGTVWTKAESAS
jgi:hypothetical protein